MLLPYNDDEEARVAVKRGLAWAAITFPLNYSTSLLARIDDGTNAADWDVEFSEMKVVMDMSSMFRNISRESEL